MNITHHTLLITLPRPLDEHGYYAYSLPCRVHAETVHSGDSMGYDGCGCVENQRTKDAVDEATLYGGIPPS